MGGGLKLSCVSSDFPVMCDKRRCCQQFMVEFRCGRLGCIGTFLVCLRRHEMVIITVEEESNYDAPVSYHHLLVSAHSFYVWFFKLQSYFCEDDRLAGFCASGSGVV